MSFLFNKNILQEVISEFNKAEKYIRIAVFQLHNEEIFNLLVEKAAKGTKVEIITLPYDSINDSVRKHVVALYKKLLGAGAKIYFLKWNVGDPERTTTAVGRWYAFHGKFFITDRVAAALSANLIERNELDAIIKYGSKIRIDEFNKKFDYLYEQFIKDDGKKLRDLVVKHAGSKASELFKLPPIIESQTHKNFWIRDYPTLLCQKPKLLKDGLYILPFDCMARNLYENIIAKASSFVYISAESFTDQDFSNYLIQTALNRKIEIKIITSASSMDFKERLNRILKELLASGIKIRTIETNLHAKLLITDHALIIGSINLNNMNLGFYKTKKYWRANTESAYLSTDNNDIKTASNQFNEIFKDAIDIENKLSEKQENKVKMLLSKVFGFRSSQEVKSLFAKLITHEDINVKNATYRLAKLTARVASIAGSRIIDKHDFIRAVILYYLSDRKQERQELTEKLSVIDGKKELDNALGWLTAQNLIEKEGSFYKIKLLKLLS